MQKNFLLVLIVSIFILIIITLITHNPPHPSPITSPTPTFQSHPYLINYSEEKKNNAVRYYQSVASLFPFILPDFITSVNIKTTIRLYHSDSDPAEITRFEILGVSYINKNELDANKNPNITAYKESFQRGLQLLKEANIDPHQLIFVYGERDYVQATASYWVEKLGLLR